MDMKVTASGDDAGVQSFIMAHLAGGQSAGVAVPISIFISAIITASVVMSIAVALPTCGIIAETAMAITQQREIKRRIEQRLLSALANRNSQVVE